MIKRLAAPAALFLLASTTAGAAAALTVEVQDLKNSSGQVVVRVFKSAEEWPRGNAVAERKAKPKGTSAKVEIDDLPAGTYAVTGYHDENGNGKHDKSALGVPQEGFLFSNDAKPGAEAPKFDEAAVKLDDKPRTVTVHMQYWSEKKE